jgi:hypothetical protein
MNKEDFNIIIKNMELLVEQINKDYDRNIQTLLQHLDRLKVIAKD